MTRLLSQRYPLATEEADTSLMAEWEARKKMGSRGTRQTGTHLVDFPEGSLPHQLQPLIICQFGFPPPWFSALPTLSKRWWHERVMMCSIQMAEERNK